jgi:hypothetical protein
MNAQRGCGLVLLALAAVLTFTAPLFAQAPPTPPTTAVLTSLTIKPDADRAQVMKVLPDEVRATVRLYLDGKIQQWYARGDGKGVVFILNCGSVAEAKGLMDTLPLSKAGLANFEFTAIGPLTPLRLLLAEPAPSSRSNPQP